MALHPTHTNSKTHKQWLHNGYTFIRVIHKMLELCTKAQKMLENFSRFLAGETL